MIIISLEDAKSKLENLPGLDYKYVLIFKDLFEKNNVQNCLELMPGMGKSSAFIATLLKDNNCAGHLTTIDLRKSKNLKPNIEEIIHQLKLDDVVTSYFERQSVNWGLMKLIKENPSPIYDFVLINGPGNWYETGYTFNLVDKLLKPGGIVIFDSLNWSYGSSLSLKNTDFVKNMDKDERESRQVRLVYDLLVKTHPSYEKFNIIDGRFGVAYKNDYNQVFDRLLNKDISDSPEIIKLENEINKLKTFQRNTNRALYTYNEYFNTIFIDYELNAKGLLKKLHDLTIDLFSFLINIFDKYSLNWWTDAGNLLGAVRHSNFIPWDDDIDLGMMREDYEKFIEILPKELKLNNLSNHIEIVFKRMNVDGKIGNGFLQLMIRPVLDGKKVLLAGIDIFPYDYLVNYEDYDEFGKLFDNIQEEYALKVSEGPDSKLLYNGFDFNEAMGEFFTRLNLSYTPQRYVTNGLDSCFGYKYTNYAHLKVFEKNILFPLKTLPYANITVKVPNDFDVYLKIHYGDDYMKIPRFGEFHNRVIHLRQISNIDQTYDEYIKLFREVNYNFK